MRALTCRELETVAGGESSQTTDAMMATVALMALCPTPLVMAVGTAALIYYAWC